MRRYKKNSGLYAFLERTGVLENGTNKMIIEAKKQYWKEYKKQWSAQKKTRTKTYDVIFNLPEAGKIIKEATKYHKSPTQYIKDCALSNQSFVIDQVEIGNIRELVVMHHSSIIMLIKKNEVSLETGKQIRDQAAILEEQILEFFLKLKAKK